MSDHQELPFVLKKTEHDLEATLEALIFVSKEPLTVDKMAELLKVSGIECDIAKIRAALKSLFSKWQDSEREIGRGLILSKVGGGYLLTTASAESAIVKSMAQKSSVDLSKPQMEVLSIVAYRQPITRVDIDEIRGVDSSNAIKRLMQFKLLKILGKSEGLGRPLLYGTTKQFLEFFSLNSLNDLPTLKQFESLGQDENVETVSLDSDQVSLKDLFQSQGNGSMFSQDVERLSDEALKSLDEALLRVEGVAKTFSK